MRQYLQARLHEERGELSLARAEYYRLLLLEPQSVTLLRRASLLEAELGENRRSLEFAERALAVLPTDPRSLWLKGVALANLGQLPDAEQALRAAIARDSTEGDYFRTLANVAKQAQDLITMEWADRRLLVLDSDEGDAWFDLTLAALQRGRFADAESLFRVARPLNPLRPGLLAVSGDIHAGLRRWPQAVADYREHLRFFPEDPGVRRGLIQALFAGGRPVEAYAEARRWAEKSPNLRAAREAEIEAAFGCGRHKEGLRSLDRWLATRPQETQAALFAVSALARHGERPEAIRRGEAFAARRPGDPDGWVVAARAHALSGETDLAVERLRTAIRLAPDSLGPRIVLARLFQEGKRYSEAALEWEEARRRSPASDMVGLELGLCREQLGDWKGAEAAVQDVLRREPDNPSALNFLGYLYADHDVKLQESVELIRRALAADPDNGAYLDSMGWAYYRMGKLEQARAQLERALARNPDDAVIHEHLGDLYRDLSQLELARDHYRKSLQSDRGNARVREKLNALR